LTNESAQAVRGVPATPPESPADSAAPKSPNTPTTTTPAAKPTPAVPPVDPAKKFAEDVEKVRVRIRDLQGQESALQLEINALNNQFFAPVTDQATQNAAQSKITDAQTRLAGVRQELTTTRATLQQMEARGPGK
jgi:hypothetical protein